VLPNAGLNVYDILRADKLVLTQDAVAALHERFNDKGGKAEAAPKKKAPEKKKTEAAKAEQGAAA
jgi:large subunit ribosomal protein L4